MKDIRAKCKKFFARPKLRCGAFSALLTVLVIAVVLVVGSIADALESQHNLQADFSFNQITSQSEVTKGVIDQLTRDVHLYYLAADGDETPTLVSLLKRYAVASPHITYSQVDITKNPGLAAQFKEELSTTTALTDDRIIVYCKENNRARVLTANNYITVYYDSEAGDYTQSKYTYEKSITEAILYTTQDELPVLQVLTGHGELTSDETINMDQFLVSSNYMIQRVNLITGGTLDPASPLMILSPVLDFNQDEMDQLDTFAAQGGSFFVLTEFYDPLDLPNFNALLLSYGMEAYPGIVIAKEDDPSNYYPGYQTYLIPAMQPTETTQVLLDAKKDTVVAPLARAYIMPEITHYLTVEPLLVSLNSYIRDTTDGSEKTEQQPTDKEGDFVIAAMCTRVENDGTRSRMFIQGCTAMFTEYSALNSYSYAYLLQVLQTLQGKSPVNLNILPRDAIRPTLSAASLTPAILITVLLPLIVLAIALVVLLPRRNR